MKTKKPIFPRVPELKMCDIPVWCHHHCSKMRVTPTDGSQDKVVIAGSVATLTITRGPDSSRTNFVINWEIIWSGVGEKVNGCVWMSKINLKTAFGLRCGWCPEEGRQLINAYGGEAAFPGQFIRWKNFLNIPGPGTGHDGDPNISVKLDEEIIAAVRRFLGD